jgi:predicted HicB family RNase H-like nuclease
LILKHEGYLAEVSYVDGDELMRGTTINTRSTLHFAGLSLGELQRAFVETNAEYKAWCAERGVEPEKGYSGTLSLRLSPELHKRVAEIALAQGESINQFIAEKLQEAVL